MKTAILAVSIWCKAVFLNCLMPVNVLKRSTVSSPNCGLNESTSTISGGTAAAIAVMLILLNEKNGMVVMRSYIANNEILKYVYIEEIGNGEYEAYIDEPKPKVEKEIIKTHNPPTAQFVLTGESWVCFPLRSATSATSRRARRFCPVGAGSLIRGSLSVPLLPWWLRG